MTADSQGEAVGEPFLDRLSTILTQLHPETPHGVVLLCKHFFSGAAAYANGKIFASLGPAGFAVKLPTQMRSALLKARKGHKFRYFPDAPIKREYVALSKSTISDQAALRSLISESIKFVTARPGRHASRKKR